MNLLYANNSSRFESVLHWSTHSLYMTTQQNFIHSSGSISNFVHSFDILWHYLTLQNLKTVIIPPHFKSQPPVSAIYKCILFGARNLQNSLNQYHESSLLPPNIFTSCYHGEISIVISMGALMSITPLLSDFSSPPVALSIKSLGGLTTASIAVTGEAKDHCLIEDYYGITWQLITTGYHIPDTSIHLFSPQTYIDKNPTKSSLLFSIISGYH